MNLTTSIMLVNKSVRPVRVSYDPDYPKQNNPDKLFKTLDASLGKGDYVVVPTNTRHGFTVCKVEEIDFIVDFNTPLQYAWVVGKVDKEAYDSILKQEQVVLERVAKAEENRQRAELVKALGLDAVELTDLDIVRGNVRLAAPATPRGADQPAAAEEPAPAEPPPAA